MKVFGKIALSVITWVIVTLIVAAALELSTGRAMPGLVPLPTLIIMVPILWFIWRRSRHAKAIASTGLTAEEFALAQRDLARGDHAAVVQRIAQSQEQKKAALRSAGIDIDAVIPEIGHQIAWSEIVGHVFRIREFDRGGTTIIPTGEVRARSATEPYGHLLVESPIMNQAVRLPIIHRDDFRLAASVFDDPTQAQVVNDAELLVTYVPKRKLPGGGGGITHALHYVIVPPGTLDKFYEADGDNMASPAPEKLFGKFVYDGEIGVGLNRDPQL